MYSSQSWCQNKYATPDLPDLLLHIVKHFPTEHRNFVQDKHIGFVTDSSPPVPPDSSSQNQPRTIYSHVPKVCAINRDSTPRPCMQRRAAHIISCNPCRSTNQAQLDSLPGPGAHTSRCTDCYLLLCSSKLLDNPSEQHTFASSSSTSDEDMRSR